jgi:predicted esterase YcpF (UPF0227 family)
MSSTVIYVHGFNSSPLSIKAQQLQVYFNEHQLPSKGYQLLVPALNFSPAIAIQQLKKLIEANGQSILLIGSSLGGYYSLWLGQQYSQCRVVLINPAVYPYQLLEDLLGENKNLYTGEKYSLTADHITELKAIDVTELTQPKRFLLLTQTGDETLDYREAVEKLASIEQRVTHGGHHSYADFPSVIEAIFEFAEH